MSDDIDEPEWDPPNCLIAMLPRSTSLALAGFNRSCARFLRWSLLRPSYGVLWLGDESRNRPIDERSERTHQAADRLQRLQG